VTRDREIAQAISEGINCIAAIDGALRANERASNDPDPSWVTVLHEMERALQGIINKEVLTSMVVSAQDHDRIRKLREMVSDWVLTCRAPDELQAEAESILRMYGISPPKKDPPT
jgi:hypothetical protein